jgi:signal transduction histidine kinase
MRQASRTSATRFGHEACDVMRVLLMSHEVVRSVIDAPALNFVVRVRIVVFNCANRFVVQLRNPLHAMYGAVEQLASGALDAAAAALELETLSHGIDVMVGISSDMLDVEALRLGRLRVAAAATNLRDVLAECVNTSKRDASLVVMQVADDVPAIINVDPLRLRQVFRVSAVCCVCDRGVRGGGGAVFSQLGLA